MSINKNNTLANILSQMDYKNYPKGSWTDAEFRKLEEWGISPFKTFEEFEIFKRELLGKINDEKLKHNDTTIPLRKDLFATISNGFFIWMFFFFMLKFLVPDTYNENGLYFYFAHIVFTFTFTITFIALRDHLNREDWKFSFFGRAKQVFINTFFVGLIIPSILVLIIYFSDKAWATKHYTRYNCSNIEKSFSLEILSPDNIAPESVKRLHGQPKSIFYPNMHP